MNTEKFFPNRLPLTVEEFGQAMEECLDFNDQKNSRLQAIDLMCEQLRYLGHRTGIDLFEETEYWDT